MSAFSSDENESLEPARLIDSAMVVLMNEVGVHADDVKSAAVANALPEK